MIPVLTFGQGGDPSPSQLAQISRIRAQHRPGCKLEIEFPTPDGPIHCWTWTRGGIDLGDQADILAAFYGYSIADLYVATDQHTTVSYDGDIRIAELRIAPAMASMRAGERADEQIRAATERALAAAPAGMARVVSFGLEMARAVAHPDQRKAA